MKKSEKIWLSVSAVAFLLGLLVVLLEFMSISIFLFGSRTIQFIGLLWSISAIAFTVFLFLILCNRKEKFQGKSIGTVLKVLSIFACVFAVFSGLVADGLLYEETIYKNVSADKRHTLIVTTTGEDTASWNVTVYKRNTPLFLQKRDRVQITDMADENELISVVWSDDGCKMYYDVLAKDAKSASDTETVAQRFFFNKNR